MVAYRPANLVIAAETVQTLPALIATSIDRPGWTRIVAGLVAMDITIASGGPAVHEPGHCKGH